MRQQRQHANIFKIRELALWLIITLTALSDITLGKAQCTSA